VDGEAQHSYVNAQHHVTLVVHLAWQHLTALWALVTRYGCVAPQSCLSVFRGCWCKGRN